MRCIILKNKLFLFLFNVGKIALPARTSFRWHLILLVLAFLNCHLDNILLLTLSASGSFPFVDGVSVATAAHILFSQTPNLFENTLEFELCAINNERCFSNLTYN